jgi:hypothetical protein
VESASKQNPVEVEATERIKLLRTVELGILHLIPFCYE